MDTSKLTDDSMFKRREKNIQQYIAMIEDERFFERMKADVSREKTNLRNFPVQADPIGHTSAQMSSKYGKSKSVSLHSQRREIELPVSEDFGNDSAAFSRDSKFGPDEIPHNDSKRRDEYHFKTKTQLAVSEQSETKVDRAKTKKDKPKDLLVKTKTIDETKSDFILTNDKKKEQNRDNNPLPSKLINEPSKEDLLSKQRSRETDNQVPPPVFADTTFQAKQSDSKRDQPVKDSDESNKQQSKPKKRFDPPQLPKISETPAKHSKEDKKKETASQKPLTTKERSEDALREKNQSVNPFSNNLSREVKPSTKSNFPIQPETAEAKYSQHRMNQSPAKSEKENTKSAFAVDPALAESRHSEFDFDNYQLKESSSVSAKPRTLNNFAIDPFFVDQKISQDRILKQSKQSKKTTPVESQTVVLNRVIIGPAIAQRRVSRDTLLVPKQSASPPPKKPDLEKISSESRKNKDKASSDLPASPDLMPRDRSVKAEPSSKVDARILLDKKNPTRMSSIEERILPNITNEDIKLDQANDTSNISEVIKADLTKNNQEFLEDLANHSAAQSKPQSKRSAYNRDESRSGRADASYKEDSFEMKLPSLDRKREASKDSDIPNAKMREETGSKKRSSHQLPNLSENSIGHKSNNPRLKTIASDKPADLVDLRRSKTADKIAPNKDHIIASGITSKNESPIPSTKTKPTPQPQKLPEVKKKKTENFERLNNESISDFKPKQDSREPSVMSGEFAREDFQQPALHDSQEQYRIAPEESLEYTPYEPESVNNRPNQPNKRNRNLNLDTNLDVEPDSAYDVRRENFERPAAQFQRPQSHIGEQHNFVRNPSDVSAVPHFTTEELARARDQIKTSIQNMFDLKNEFSPDSELSQLIARFYHLMMDERNKLGKEKTEVIIELVTFYQDYVKKLKNEMDERELTLKTKDNIYSNEVERNRELEKKIKNLKFEIKDLHEEKLDAVKKINVIEVARKENDHKVRQIEQKYHENIKKFKDLLRNANEEFSHARKNEMQAVDKLNALKAEYERLYGENIGLKSELTNLDYKDKERRFEIERLIEDMRSQINKNEALLRERDLLGNRIKEYQLKMAEFEGTKIEAENIKARANELQRHLEGAKAELRNRDLQLMEFGHKLQYNENVRNMLYEENARIIENRQEQKEKAFAKMDDFGENMFAAEYQRLNQSGRTLKRKVDYEDRTYDTSANNKLDTPIVRAKPMRNPIVPTAQVRPVAGAGTRMPTNDLERRNLVQEYNSQLTHYQDRKVILDSMLCRVHDNPRSQKVV